MYEKKPMINWQSIRSDRQIIRIDFHKNLNTEEVNVNTSDTTMSWNKISKVLDLKRPFQSTRKEASERRNQ